VQLFIVSNRDSTYYFANNNARHFAFNTDERFLPIYEHARPNNSKVKGLDAFAEAFLPKCVLAQMISRYMVLVASEQKLMMMRPYQIYAVKHIVDCIERNLGDGYIWHTTGSGKTLTSFKASTLLKANPTVDKCIFVVDRKDLDRQTREEFNRFQEGCVPVPALPLRQLRSGGEEGTRIGLPRPQRDQQRRQDAAIGVVRGQPRRRGGVRKADAPQGALRRQA